MFTSSAKATTSIAASPRIGLSDFFGAEPCPKKHTWNDRGKHTEVGVRPLRISSNTPKTDDHTSAKLLNKNLNHPPGSLHPAQTAPNKNIQQLNKIFRVTWHLPLVPATSPPLHSQPPGRHRWSWEPLPARSRSASSERSVTSRHLWSSLHLLPLRSRGTNAPFAAMPAPEPFAFGPDAAGTRPGARRDEYLECRGGSGGVKRKRARGLLLG